MPTAPSRSVILTLPKETLSTSPLRKLTQARKRIRIVPIIVLLY
jgi:hypothetical protein